MHPDNISSKLSTLVDVCTSVDGVVANVVDVGGDFGNKEDFVDRESMLTWIRRTAISIGFSVVIGRSDNGTSRRNAFVTIVCERSGKYHLPLKKYKRDDTSTRKCECTFRIRCYKLSNLKWRCSVICGLHNHDLYAKLQGHPIACRFGLEEKTSIKDMSLNFVQPKNILATLKRKEPDNIANIKQVYNQQYRSRKESMGDRSEMQHLLKMLDDNKYVVRYRSCDNDVTV
ncbi:uncharacterized protein LOC131648473 [Vicia villosa]|uniref:uncharacterized protein LOC131648473 n=1 Tax=Vicia villosa TaxID=3911 RepID=UPI00273BE087|nr:uncharacterized protein LOC131648473 [Vicia villosa]